MAGRGRTRKRNSRKRVSRRKVSRRRRVSRRKVSRRKVSRRKMRGGSDNPPLDVEVGGWNASKGMGPLGGKWKYKAGITLGVLGRRSATTDGPSSLYVYYNKGGRQKGGLVNTLRLVQRPHDEEELKATKKVDSLTGPGYYIKTMPNSVGYTRGSRTEEEERFFIAKDAFE